MAQDPNLKPGMGRAIGEGSMGKQANSYGVTFLGMLTLLFIGLKLGEVGVVAEWSWWWVLSPLWLPWVVIVALTILIHAALRLWRAVK